MQSPISDTPGGYRPQLPDDNRHPFFRWPPKPRSALKWLCGFPGYLWPWLEIFVGLALLTWLFLVPDLETMRSFSLRWIAWLLVQNLLLLVLFVGPWHIRLYTQRAQGKAYKYNNRWLSEDNPTFLFRSQLWDNVFWNLCSAVPVSTAYEAVTFWMQANGFAPLASWRTDSLYCVFLLLLTPLWIQAHFYATHRLLHWEPLYRTVHYVHHKNVNVGPWSGVAMHPVEHLIFFSGIILFWFVPSTPLHILYVLQGYTLAPSLDHLGFDRVVLTKRFSIHLDHYMHYLHHKYVKVNYGNETVPFDWWFGTFHDGSERATEVLKQRAEQQRRPSKA